MIEVKNICYHYKGYPEVLNNVNFSLEKGEFLAILGNNGVGKSTLLKCLAKIIQADSGEVLLDKENLLRLNHHEIAKRVAFVAQQVPSTQLTVHDIVMLGRKPYMGFTTTEHDHEIVHASMDRLDLHELRGRYLNELSGGERQKVMIARALAQDPKLMLLDEPTSSLDIKNQYNVLSIVREICHTDGLSAIVVIHDLNLALRFCDKFLLLKNGEVYDYGSSDIINEKSLLEVYGVKADVINTHDRKMVIVEEIE